MTATRCLDLHFFGRNLPPGSRTFSYFFSIVSIVGISDGSVITLTAPCNPGGIIGQIGNEEVEKAFEELEPDREDIVVVVVVVIDSWFKPGSRMTDSLVLSATVSHDKRFPNGW